MSLNKVSDNSKQIEAFVIQEAEEQPALPEIKDSAEPIKPEEKEAPAGIIPDLLRRIRGLVRFF